MFWTANGMWRFDVLCRRPHTSNERRQRGSSTWCSTLGLMQRPRNILELCLFSLSLLYISSSCQCHLWPAAASLLATIPSNHCPLIPYTTACNIGKRLLLSIMLVARSIFLFQSSNFSILQPFKPSPSPPTPSPSSGWLIQLTSIQSYLSPFPIPSERSDGVRLPFISLLGLRSLLWKQRPNSNEENGILATSYIVLCVVF